MRKLIMKMSVSVDGFVGRSNGELEWVFKSSDETSRAWLVEQTREADLIIMGRKSFETMAPFWVTAPGPIAAAMNEIPKALFTKKGFKGIELPAQPAAASWSAAQIIEGDLTEEITKLKSQAGGPILAIAGAGFMQSLIATGLIDEYRIVTHPVILGEGLPIFNAVAKPLDLRLADIKTFPGGIVVHTYHPA